MSQEGMVMEGGADAGEECLSEVVFVMEERSQDPVTLIANVVTEGEAASGEEGGAAGQTNKEEEGATRADWQRRKMEA